MINRRNFLTKAAAFVGTLPFLRWFAPNVDAGAVPQQSEQLLDCMRVFRLGSLPIVERPFPRYERVRLFCRKTERVTEEEPLGQFCASCMSDKDFFKYATQLLNCGDMEPPLPDDHTIEMLGVSMYGPTYVVTGISVPTHHTREFILRVDVREYAKLCMWTATPNGVRIPITSATEYLYSSYFHSEMMAKGIDVIAAFGSVHDAVHYAENDKWYSPLIRLADGEKNVFNADIAWRTKDSIGGLDY